MLHELMDTNHGFHLPYRSTADAGRGSSETSFLHPRLVAVPDYDDPKKEQQNFTICSVLLLCFPSTISQLFQGLGGIS